MGSQWVSPSLTTNPPPSSSAGRTQGVPEPLKGHLPRTARRPGASDKGDLEVSREVGGAESEAVTDGGLAKRQSGWARPMMFSSEVSVDTLTVAIQDTEPGQKGP